MRNEDIKELLEAKLSGFKAEIKASANMQEFKLDQLINYQKEQNDKVSELGKRVQKNTHWRLRITAAGSVIAGAISFVLIRFGSIISTIKELIKTD